MKIVELDQSTTIINIYIYIQPEVGPLPELAGFKAGATGNNNNKLIDWKSFKKDFSLFLDFGKNFHDG